MTEAARRVVPGSGRRIVVPCQRCAPSLKPGHLWLGGRDYVECPDCEGAGLFKFYEERTAPPPARVFLVHQKG